MYSNIYLYQKKANFYFYLEQKTYSLSLMNSNPPKVLVPVGHGAEEIETTAIVDILRRAELNVILASIYSPHNPKGFPTIKGSRDISFFCDDYLEHVIKDEFDCIALPGGALNAGNLAKSAILIEKLK